MLRWAAPPLVRAFFGVLATTGAPPRSAATPRYQRASRLWPPWGPSGRKTRRGAASRPRPWTEPCGGTGPSGHRTADERVGREPRAWKTADGASANRNTNIGVVRACDPRVLPGDLGRGDAAQLGGRVVAQEPVRRWRRRTGEPLLVDRHDDRATEAQVVLEGVPARSAPGRFTGSRPGSRPVNARASRDR